MKNGKLLSLVLKGRLLSATSLDPGGTTACRDVRRPRSSRPCHRSPVTIYVSMPRMRDAVQVEHFACPNLGGESVRITTTYKVMPGSDFRMLTGFECGGCSVRCGVRRRSEGFTDTFDWSRCAHPMAPKGAPPAA